MKWESHFSRLSEIKTWLKDTPMLKRNLNQPGDLYNKYRWCQLITDAIDSLLIWSFEKYFKKTRMMRRLRLWMDCASFKLMAITSKSALTVIYVWFITPCWKGRVRSKNWLILTSSDVSTAYRPHCHDETGKYQTIRSELMQWSELRRFIWLNQQAVESARKTS